MFEYLSGELARKSPTEAVVDANGVGYHLTISERCFRALPASGRVKLYVHVHHSEETGTRLFGFVDERERAFFRLLQTVRGVGPAMALALLSREPPEILANRLASSDVKGLKKIKGVGVKTADRLCYELKDKVVTTPGLVVGDHVGELESALENLGLDPGEAATCARTTAQALPEERKVDVLLVAALKARAAARR
jgi:Holliday junction DNA helicase RuvA